MYYKLKSVKFRDGIRLPSGLPKPLIIMVLYLIPWSVSSNMCVYILMSLF